MTGMELLLAAVCLNVSTCEPGMANAPTTVTPLVVLSGNENVTADEWEMPSSAMVKEKELQKLRDELNGQVLRIAMMEDFPLSYTENNTAKGVAFRLLAFLTKKFNFTYTVIKPELNIYGSTGDYNGSLIQLLNESRADMAAVFLPLLADARKFVDFSTATLDEGNWIMMMRRPGESATGSGLLAPFDREVWLLILLSLLTVGPSIYGLIIIRMKLTRDKEQQIYPLPHCIWFVYGALMKQGSTLSPLADSTRLLFATWWIFITILTSFYTANLTAFLTLSKFTLPYNTMEDILTANQKFVSTRGGAVEYAIKNVNESLQVLQTMVNKGRVEFSDKSASNDNETLVTYVEKQNYVLIKDRPSIDHLIYADYKYRKTISHGDRNHCPFAISKKPFLTKKRSFAYSFDFKFSRLFDPELLNLVESGIVKYMLFENLPSAKICPQELGSSERQLRNGDLWMTYQIMAAGFATGAIIFFTEIIFKYLLHRRDRKRHVQPFEKAAQSAFKTDTPPPSYGTLFDPTRRRRQLQQQQHAGNAENGNNNVWTTHRLGGSSGEVHRYINGRQYKVTRDTYGQEQLVPMGTPSATLFQYQYTN